LADVSRVSVAWHEFRRAAGMTTKRLLGAGLFSIALFACAGDPNKQANDAHDAELKSERKQTQNNAEKRSDNRVDAAEAQRDTTDANASGTSARKNSVQADSKMTEARTVYRAKATERLEKADARTAELTALVEKAGAKATTSSRDALKTVETQRGLVTRELDQLPQQSDDDFKQAQTSLDTQLDNLEGLVKQTGKEVDKFKK
jgi:hypothetical protein